MALQAWWIQWLTTWVEANVTMFWPKLASSARMHFLCLQLSGWNYSKTHSVSKQLKVVCLADWWRKWQRDSTEEAKEAAAAALAFPRWQTPWCAVSSWNLLPKWCDPAQKMTEMGSKMVSYDFHVKDVRLFQFYTNAEPSSPMSSISRVMCRAGFVTTSGPIRISPLIRGVIFNCGLMLLQMLRCKRI